MDRINQVIDLEENQFSFKKWTFKKVTNRRSCQNQKDLVENDQPVNDGGYLNHVIATCWCIVKSL